MSKTKKAIKEPKMKKPKTKKGPFETIATYQAADDSWLFTVNDCDFKWHEDNNAVHSPNLLMGNSAGQWVPLTYTEKFNNAVHYAAGFVAGINYQADQPADPMPSPNDVK